MERNLIDDLAEAVRQHLLAQMPADPSGELSAMPLGSLLIKWFNWQDRYIPAVPRRVHDSNELLGNSAAVTHAAALGLIRSAIAAGEDLTHRLSNRAGTAYIPMASGAPLHRRHDLDLLLADWGIHHLHLSPADDGGRTPELLFAVFRPGDAYLLQILTHESWTDVSLLEVIVRNWPDAGLLAGSISGLALAEPITPEDRKRFRRGGVATPVEVDGKLYLPRGQSTAGTALDHATRANMLMATLGEWRRHLDSHEAYPDLWAKENGRIASGQGRWRPFIDARKFGLRDEITADRIEIGEF